MPRRDRQPGKPGHPQQARKVKKGQAAKKAKTGQAARKAKTGQAAKKVKMLACPVGVLNAEPAPRSSGVLNTEPAPRSSEEAEEKRQTVMVQLTGDGIRLFDAFIGRAADTGTTRGEGGEGQDGDQGGGILERMGMRMVDAMPACPVGVLNTEPAPRSSGVLNTEPAPRSSEAAEEKRRTVMVQLTGDSIRLFDAFIGRRGVHTRHYH